MNKTVIYSKRCWTGNRLQPATVWVEEGRITKIETGMLRSGNATDVGDKILMPGAIDAHVHVNEPGRTEWEGFDTATRAAAAGGVTTIVDMPLNASPVTTTAKALEEKRASAVGKLHVNCGFYGGLVPGNLHELEDLIKGGVLGVKAFLTHSGIDEFPQVGEMELDAAMPLLAKYDLPLLAHCEWSDDLHKKELSSHPASYRAFLDSRPKEWENKAVQLMIDLCRKHRCKTHIVHVSSADALQLIRKAKEEGMPLTAETCPHYIYFHAEAIPDGNTLFKCAPPIRDKENNERLKKALNDGTLDFIASDHSPAPPSMKEIQSGNLQKAWGGIAGLQFLLSAAWTALMDQMNIEKFIPLVTGHPARFLNIHHKKGFIEEGADADLVVWDPEQSFAVKEDAILHKHKISPYVSRVLFGKIHRTYVNGELVFSEGRNIQEGRGKEILKEVIV
jgi:allantoinase